MNVMRRFSALCGTFASGVRTVPSGANATADRFARLACDPVLSRRRGCVEEWCKASHSLVGLIRTLQGCLRGAW